VNVSLTPELEPFIQAKVKSGRYLSASEVVREALRLLEERDRVREAQIETFRKEAAIINEQSDRILRAENSIQES
jgi:antitoxin ParD1/3/4